MGKQAAQAATETMADPGERLGEMGFLNVQPTRTSGQASAATPRFEVNVRGSICELNNDIMERMQLLMTNIGSGVTSDLDQRIKRAEGYVDK